MRDERPLRNAAPALQDHHNGLNIDFLTGRPHEARLLAEKACREQPNFLPSLRAAAAGRLAEARGFTAPALQLDPELRISNLKERIAPLAPDRLAMYVKVLRKAGVHK